MNFYLIRMRSILMFRSVASIAKCFAAAWIFASIWFLASMRSEVGLEILQSRVSFEATFELNPQKSMYNTI